MLNSQGEKMKKKFLLLFAAIVALMFTLVIVASAEEVFVNNVYYTITDNSSYEGYNGTATVNTNNQTTGATDTIATIPDFITLENGNKYIVNAIAKDAFTKNKLLTEIRVLSDYITVIPENFILGTTGGALQKVYINFSNITAIGHSAFNQSTNASYGMNATLTNFYFYDAAAFKANGSEVKVTNPDLSNLTSLGNYSMQGVKFDTLVLPAAITSVSARCFQAAQIGTLRINASMTKINESAFNLGASPAAVYVDLSKTTTISSSSFRFAASNTTTRWYNLDGEPLVDISNVTSIGEYGFYNSNLGSASIAWPKALTSALGGHAFRNCNLTGVAYFGADSSKSLKVPDWCFNGNNFSAIIFGEGITSIGESNFSSGITVIFLADTINFSSSSSIPKNSTVYAKATGGSSQASTVNVIGFTRYELSNSKFCGVVINLYDKASNMTTFGALNHTEDNGTPTVPSCTVPAGIEYKCTLCSSFIRYVETAAAPGHTYDVNAPISVSNLTCTTDEKKSFLCSACGETFEIITAYATGHDHSIISYPVVSTDGVPGVKRLTCANFDGACGDYYEYDYKISPAELPVYITFNDGTTLTVTGADIFTFEISVTNNVYSCKLNSVKSSFTFEGTTYSASNIKSLSIPYGFTSVLKGFSLSIPVLDFSTAGDVAFGNTFQDNHYLKEITLGDGAKLGGSMFRGATGISIIRIADGATVVFPAGQNVFYDFRSLDKFIIGNGANVRFERNKTFDITMSEAVKARLSTIEIGDNATVYFGYNTFNGEPNLTTIKFGKNGNYTFEQYAFKGCTALESIIIPEGSTVTIAANAFENCTALESVFLPSSVASIPASTFSGCTALKSAVLIGATSIGENAFKATTETILTVYAHAQADLTLHANAFANRTNVVLYTMSTNVTSLPTAAYTIYSGIPHAQYLDKLDPSCTENGYDGYATSCPCGNIVSNVTYTIYANDAEAITGSYGAHTVIPSLGGHTDAALIVYANGFDKAGTKCTVCAVCDAVLSDTTDVKAIFTHEGYSYKLRGEVTGIESAFRVDQEALKAYEASINGKKLNFGMIIVNPAYLGDSFFVNGKISASKAAIQVQVDLGDYSIFSCYISGFQKLSADVDLELVIAGYVYEGTDLDTFQIMQKTYAEGDESPAVSKVTKTDATLLTVNIANVKTPVAFPAEIKEFGAQA